MRTLLSCCLEGFLRSLTHIRRPACVNRDSPSSPLYSQLSPYASPFFPSGLQLGLSYTPMSIVWPSQAVGSNEVKTISQSTPHMECVGRAPKKFGSIAIESRHSHGLDLRHQLLNSFVHLGPQLDLESALITSGSSLPYDAPMSYKSTVGMACHSEVQQQDRSLMPGMTTRVGEFVVPRKGGGCDHRSRQLEATFVKGFRCCQLRLNGMHELLDQ